MSTFRSNRGARKPYSRPSPRGDVNGQWLHDRAPGTKTSLNDDSRPREPANAAASNTKLLVSNLHYEITPKDLTAIFGQIGTLVREPLIRYDRSGRSSGVAVITYETAPEATRAKKQFDGILAKGQPMSIAFDTSVPRPRRVVSAPTSSLINRIQKPALADRLARDDSQVKDTSGPGPIRSRPSRRGRGSAPRPAPKKPKTAEELDKELDAFMGDSEPTSIQQSEEKASEPVAGDVEMA